MEPLHPLALPFHLTKLIATISLIVLVAIFYGRKPTKQEIAPAIAGSIGLWIFLNIVMVVWGEGMGDPLLMTSLPLFLLLTLRFPNSNIGKGLGVICVVLLFVLRIEHFFIVQAPEYTDSIYLIKRYRATAALSESKKQGDSEAVRKAKSKKALDEAGKHIFPLWHTWLTGIYWVER
jgi:cell division protein FtsW (lipid II flippase)